VNCTHAGLDLFWHRADDNYISAEASLRWQLRRPQAYRYQTDCSHTIIVRCGPFVAKYTHVFKGAAL
jgi:hypothetical protein